jgi:hypothetical protein
MKAKIYQFEMPEANVLTLRGERVPEPEPETPKERVDKQTPDLFGLNERTME